MKIKRKTEEKFKEEKILYDFLSRDTVSFAKELLGKLIKVKYGESIFIPLGAKHRIENRSSELLVFIEVQTGTYFGEDDIVRIEDDYSREGK